ncbi:Serine/threonine-protein phosphatase [Entamoeba marina]
MTSTFDIDRIINRLWNYEMLEEYLIKQVTEKAIEIMSKEPTVLTLQLPCTVVGDIHGQFHDLKELFAIGGTPPQTNYVDPDENQLDKFHKSSRGAGCMFNGLAVQEFNQKNNTTLICRAHQLAQDGYQWFFQNTLVTVWSAPKYCYRMDNVASVMEIDNATTYSFKVFEAAPQDPKGFVSRRNVPDYFA